MNLGWYVTENFRVEDGRMVFDLRIRRWHPVLWLMVAAAALRAAYDRIRL